MQVDVISLFPDWVDQLRDYGVVGRGIRNHRLELQTWNPRDYSNNRNRRVDDRPFGGGPGMVMQVGPLENTLAAIRNARASDRVAPVVMLSPQGESFDQDWAQALGQREKGFVLLCGRYEGVDQRFIDNHVDVQLSVGDFVLSGGELPAMMVIDAVARLMPGVLGDADSAMEDSFAQGILDHPHYTRPATSSGESVPDILLSGDHAAIDRWRKQQALGRTWLRRPDLLDGLKLSDEQVALLREFIAGEH